MAWNFDFSDKPTRNNAITTQSANDWIGSFLTNWFTRNNSTSNTGNTGQTPTTNTGGTTTNPMDMTPEDISALLRKFLGSNPGAHDVATAWFANAVKQLPNVATGYVNSLNTALGNINNQNTGLTQLINTIYPNFSNLLQQLQGSYQTTNENMNMTLPKISENFGNLQSRFSDIMGRLMQANNRVNTGELSPETRAWIDEIYKQNADLINQQAQQYIDAQSRNLVDKMAGRGILTSGVTGRAMGEMMAEADKTRQQALTEALKQRATTMLQMPFQQQEAAAQLLQGITTGTQLTGTEAQTIVDSLMKQWGMSRENAEAALNNLIANYGASMKGYEQLLESAAMAPTLIGKGYETMGALGNSLFEALISKYLKEKEIAASIQNTKTAADARNESDNTALIGTVLGGMLGSGGSCVSEDTVIMMADGTTKLAKDIKEGDLLRTFNINTDSLTQDEVEFVETSQFEYYYKVTLKNGTILKTTTFHPYLTFDGKRKRWAATAYWTAVKLILKKIVSDKWKFFSKIPWLWKALKNYKNMKTGQLVVLMPPYGTCKIASIEKIIEPVTMFNFGMKDRKHSSFIANMIIVEGLNEWTKDFIDWVVDSGNYPKK